MKAENLYILIELALAGGLIGFAWWQVRLMRKDRLERERQEREKEQNS
ncbi:MAG: hypothetical protein AAGH74_10475 [Pseudomonadota bacterium]